MNFRNGEAEFRRARPQAWAATAKAAPTNPQEMRAVLPNTRGWIGYRLTVPARTRDSLCYSNTRRADLPGKARWTIEGARALPGVPRNLSCDNALQLPLT